MKLQCQKRRHFIFLPHSFLLCQSSLHWSDNEDSWGCLNSQLNREVHARFLVFSLSAGVDGGLGLVPLMKTRCLPLVSESPVEEIFIYFFSPFYICFWNIARVHVWAPIVNNGRWKPRGHVGRLSSPIFKGSEHLNLTVVKCFNDIKCLFLAGFCTQGCWFSRVSALFSTCLLAVYLNPMQRVGHCTQKANNQ